MFDVDKGDLVVDQDWWHCALLLSLEHHWEKLINHWHIHITTIVPGDQGLLGERDHRPQEDQEQKVIHTELALSEELGFCISKVLFNPRPYHPSARSDPYARWDPGTRPHHYLFRTSSSFSKHTLPWTMYSSKRLILFVQRDKWPVPATMCWHPSSDTRQLTPSNPFYWHRAYLPPSHCSSWHHEVKMY